MPDAVACGLSAGPPIRFEPFAALSPTTRTTWQTMAATLDGHESVYASPAFFDALADTETPDHLVIAAIPDSQNRVQGIAALRKKALLLDPHGLAGRLLTRRLAVWGVLGSTPLMHESCDGAASIAGFIAALAEAPGRFDALELQSLEVGSATWQAVFESDAVRAQFMAYLPNGIRSCHQTPLPDTVEAYLAQYPRKKRYNLSRQLRQIGENLGGPPTVVPLTDIATLDTLFDAVAQIGGGGGAVLSRAEYASLARQGLLLNFVVQAGGAPIAVVLGIPSGSVYRINRVLYAHSLAPYSPGTSTLHLFNEWIIADGRFKVVDFGFGEPGRTYSSSNRMVQRARVMLLRRTLPNRIAITLHRAVVALEKCGRTLLAHAESLRGRTRAFTRRKSPPATAAADEAN